MKENNKNTQHVRDIKFEIHKSILADDDCCSKKNILIIFLGTLGFVMPIPVLRIYPIMQESYIMQIVKINRK